MILINPDEQVIITNYYKDLILSMAMNDNKKTNRLLSKDNIIRINIKDFEKDFLDDFLTFINKITKK